MALSLRHYRDDSDYWRARTFLRKLHRLDDRAGGNWHVALFDYWRWHWLENVVERTPDELCLWETQDGEIAAISQACYQKAEEVLQANRDKLEKLALALIQYVRPWSGVSDRLVFLDHGEIAAGDLLEMPLQLRRQFGKDIFGQRVIRKPTQEVC